MKRLWRVLSWPARRAWRFWWQQAIPPVWWVLSFLRRPSQAVEVWPEGDVRLGARVAVFVHFDRGGAVRPYVVAYLRALRSCGFSVAFVSNCPRLRPEAVETVRAICSAVILRRNVGYDFGAFREGIERLGLPRAETETVLLVNDSAYGPLQPLEDVFRQINFGRADLWGLTESWQDRYHLQSYFVAFGRAALTSPAWGKFWARVRPVSSKWWVIRHYEIGMTQHFLRAGLRACAVWPYADLVGRALVAVPPLPRLPDGEEPPADPIREGLLRQVQRIREAAAARRALNPTADLWCDLLRTGFPFIKRELLQRNPGRVANIATWREVAAAAHAGGIDLVEQDLKLAMRDRAP